ncbi:MAG: MBL fold metallo-hydrolase [Bacteriovoracaceae bacterium]|nr:MBL fold metallo-hydrolase [Bacteriovoracaceae bacterium]
MKLTFLGGAGTVTGSKTLIEYHNKRVLVDYGLFQGPKKIRDLNWTLQIDPHTIDAILLTHAHVDHCGALPLLVKNGLKCPIYCSLGTADLLKIILLDSAHLQEEDARYANESGHSHHKPALPLYTIEDAQKTLNLIRPLPLNQWHTIKDNFGFQLIRSGHILGSTFVQLSFEENNESRLITFSGDLGSDRLQVIKGPSAILETDYLVMEATYGDRIHPKTSIEDELLQLVQKIYKQKGVLVIPAFSVGRTQEILYYLQKLESKNLIPHIPTYLDSPMSLNATQIYLNHPEELKLNLEKDNFSAPFNTSLFKATRTTLESQNLNAQEGPMIIISAAGMLTGGRILHHLKRRLPDANNVVLFVGYQPEGTKGRLLQNGIDTLNIHHTPVAVKASIATIQGFSAHADCGEIITWMKHLVRAPKQVFLNHGEEMALESLKYRIENELKFPTTVAKMNGVYSLT